MRLPLLPTIIVAAAVAMMIWLGLWQLGRAEEKERLLVQYASAATLPAVDLDPLLDGDGPRPPLSFRRALVSCHARDVAPEVRTGRSAADATGQVYLVPCRPGAPGLAGRLRVNAGWAPRHDAVEQLTLDGLVAGRLGVVEEKGGDPITLTSATASPPLAPSAPVSIEAIPNNHLLYALQWFFFAAAAAVIYILAVRKRRQDLPPEP